MKLIPQHVLAMGNAFYAFNGVLMAAPVLVDNTIEWAESVEVDGPDADPYVIARIERLLGLA